MSRAVRTYATHAARRLRQRRDLVLALDARPRLEVALADAPDGLREDAQRPQQAGGENEKRAPCR